MNRFLTILFVVLCIARTAPAATVSLEVVTERGVQITAPTEWLQLLTDAGVANVRIRGARAGDQPAIESSGGESRSARIRVTGVLSARGELRLPGGRFTRRDVAGLRDYFDRLTADGAEAVTEPTGNYGLTRKQFEKLFEQLKQPLATTTKDQTAESLLSQLKSRRRLRIVVDRSAATHLRGGKPIGDELSSLSIGTGLAIALRYEGLLLTPVKPRGREVELHVIAAPLRRTAIEAAEETWPIGYRVKGPPRQTAPSLMKSINVEIEGYTLIEAVGAITPRLGLPLLWDKHALAVHKIDPATIDVKLPRSRSSYKRILERLLFQARLKGELRVDEAGTPFYWVTR